jgi:Domain of unknown function (DUF5667)
MEEYTMNTRFSLLVGLVALGLLCAIGAAAADDNTTGTQGVQLVDDIQAYNGSIGADSSLYGLKIAFENLDDSFTFNQTERLEKEIGHADLRLSEVKGALADNRTDAADRALDQYWQNMNQTERTIDRFNGTPPQSSSNGAGSTPAPVDSGLMHAQEMLLQHQAVLENLLSTHSDNPGLSRAYNNSRDLEQKIEQKTQTQFERYQDADNRVWLRAEHLGPGTGDLTRNGTLPADTGGLAGPVADRTVSGSGNERPGQASLAGNRYGQISGNTTQISLDQHGSAGRVIPTRNFSPSGYQEYRDGNGSGTDSRNDIASSYRNGNTDSRSRTR